MLLLHPSSPKKRFWYSKPGVTQMVKPNKSLQFDLGVPSQKTSYLQLWSPKTFMFLGHPTKHMEPTFTYIFTVKKWSREKGHKGNLWIFPSPIWLLLTSPQFVSEDCPLQTARHGRHRDPSCYSPGVSAGDVLKNYWGHLEGWGIWRNGPIFVGRLFLVVWMNERRKHSRCVMFIYIYIYVFS